MQLPMNDFKLNVAITIDVEEEGLFSGFYSPKDCSVTNVRHLWKLDGIFRDFGIRPTLLTTYQVAKNDEGKKILQVLKNRWEAEIGAHLHHWNTDPIIEMNLKQPVPSEMIPKDYLTDKTINLLRELSSISGDRPVSFRMGRFNLGPKMFSILEEVGINVDSSVAPLRSEYGGPDHIDAPSDPYYPDPDEPTKLGQSKVMEAPITINPLFRGIASTLRKVRSTGLLENDKLMNLLSNVVSVPAQPAWVGLEASKAGVIFHRLKKGRFLTIFFHSSELAPGLNPLYPTEEAVQGFLIKLKRLITWLLKRYDTRFITLSEVPRYYLS